MFKMSCVLACALSGGRVGTTAVPIYHVCILLVFISNYTTIHGASTVFRNIEIRLRSDTMSYPRRTETSTSILHNQKLRFFTNRQLCYKDSVDIY